MNRSLRVALLAGVSVLPASVSWAAAEAVQNQQVAQAAVASPPGAIEEILVTARRREENLEKVPMSVFALNAAALQQRGVVSEADLQSAAPGLVVRESEGQHNYTFIIRGQTVDAYSGTPPAVLVYYDDINVAAHAQSTLFDIQSIQVLKGPQGTLFGRNTTGGAVLYETTKPGDKFGGYIDAQGGSYGSAQVQAAVDIPIDPKVAVRLAGNYDRNDGFVYNLATKEWTGGSEAESVRGTVELKPTDNLKNTTMVQYDHRTGISLANELTSVYKCGTPNLNTTIDCATGGATYAELLAQRARGAYVSNIDTPEHFRAESYLMVNTTQYEVNADTTIKNIFGFGRGWSKAPYDYDATPFPLLQNTLFNGGEFMGSTNYSEELQALGSMADGRLKYTAGLYYSHQKDILGAPLNYFGFSFPYNADTRERTIAGYVQASYQLVDKLSLTGGIRYTDDKVRLVQIGYSVFGPGHPEEQKVKKPSWTVSLDYQATSDVMLYAVTRGSYRAGGFNNVGTPVDATAATGGNRFLPEQVKDVEIGIKAAGRIGDMPYRFNVDGYNAWVTNVQRVAYVIIGGNAPIGLTVNLDKAQITGADGDLELKMTDWLTVGGAFAYTYARFTQPNVVLFGSTQHFGPFADAPKWSGSLYGVLSYELPGEGGMLSLRTDFYGQSKYYFSNLERTSNPDAVVAGYGLVNMKLTWAHIYGSRVSASLAVKNLTDKTYYYGGLQEGSDLGVNSQVPGRPRWVTGELRYEF